MQSANDNPKVIPSIVPLGDSAALVRFGQALDDVANQRALRLFQALDADPIAGVVEIVPSLISVLVRYDPAEVSFPRLSGELALRLDRDANETGGTTHQIAVRFGGDAGFDLQEVAEILRMSESAFIAEHNRRKLRVLTTGFAPGFVYCGFHSEALHMPRREGLRSVVPAGTVLFAAGQTAITATNVPTGWHVIGQTDFSNFDVSRMPPTQLAAGDFVEFVSV